MLWSRCQGIACHGLQIANDVGRSPGRLLVNVALPPRVGVITTSRRPAVNRNSSSDRETFVTGDRSPFQKYWTLLPLTTTRGPTLSVRPQEPSQLNEAVEALAEAVAALPTLSVREPVVSHAARPNDAAAKLAESTKILRMSSPF